MQLQQVRRHAVRGDHEWIAAQAVDCSTASDRCGRLHLIKGDACFELAREGNAPMAYFSCAVDELSKGLALIPSWDAPDHQFRFQEMLCDALLNLQRLQSGRTAEQTLAHLEEAAKALYQLSPESVAAVYYLSSARLQQITPMLPGMTPATRLPACHRLRRTVTHVLSLMGKADNQVLPGWDRFADDYQRLAFELGSAMQAAGCR